MLSCTFVKFATHQKKLTIRREVPSRERAIEDCKVFHSSKTHFANEDIMKYNGFLLTVSWK